MEVVRRRRQVVQELLDVVADHIGVRCRRVADLQQRVASTLRAACAAVLPWVHERLCGNHNGGAAAPTYVDLTP